MNKKRLWVTVSLILVFFIASCTSKLQSEKEQAFNHLIPMSAAELNNQLEIDLPVNIDYLTIGETIDLWLKNNTKNKIIFQTDSGIQMYRYDNQLREWVKVRNLKNYVPSGDAQVSPKEENPIGRIFPVLPEIEDNNENVDLRIVIIGNVMDESNRAEKEVGAYLDVTLHPQQ